jgi:hypothetical protein
MSWRLTLIPYVRKNYYILKDCLNFGTFPANLASQIQCYKHAEVTLLSINTKLFPEKHYKIQNRK